MGRQTIEEIGEVFGIINLIRDMPTAVVYGSIVVHISPEYRRALYESLAGWEAEHGKQAVS